MDHSRNLAGKETASGKVTVEHGLAHRACAESAKFVGAHCGIRFHACKLLAEGGLEAADSVVKALSCNNRTHVGGGYEALFVHLVHAALIGDQEARSHLHPAGPEHEGGSGSATVEDTSRGKHGDIQGVHHLGHKGHGVGIADMAAGFSAFRHNCCGAKFLHLERVGH